MTTRYFFDFIANGQHVTDVEGMVLLASMRPGERLPSPWSSARYRSLRKRLYSARRNLPCFLCQRLTDGP